MHLSSFALLLAAGFLSLLLQQTQAESPKPNIIYILADDLGIGDIGPYGQKLLRTPHLDRLAAEGLKFTRHYSGATVCAPSRCVLLTGLHTGHSAIRGNGIGLVPDDAMTVPKLLKQHGYHTAAIGKYGLGKPLPLDDPQRKGFDHFFGYVGTSHAHNFYPEALVRNGKIQKLDNEAIPSSMRNPNDYLDTNIPTVGVAKKDKRNDWAPQLFSDEVQKYLQERGKNQKTPFFLYYALNIPHTNNEAKADSPLGHGMESPDYGEFANKEWPNAEKGFAQFIRFLDNEVGKILHQLQAQGLDENTLILFSSDNGPHKESGHDPNFFDSNGPHRGIKRDLTDGGIRVPFLVRWPSKIQGGTSTDHVSSFQDLLATVADLSGAKIDFPTDGISYAPTLLGDQKSQKTHPYLFWHFDEQGGKQAVLQWPWKLIHLRTGIVKARNHQPRPWSERTVELYNLETNPEEDINLAKKHPEIVAKLEQYIKEAYVHPNP